MALNEKIVEKVKAKTTDKPLLEKSIIDLLKGVEDSKQLRRIIADIVRTI